MTRRDFVKAGGTAAGAAHAIQRAHAASQQVPYGVIGTGAQGGYLLRHMAGLQGCRCVAVCDIDSANLKKGVAAAGSKPQSYGDYRELLARKDVDAVLIATTQHWHGSFGR